MYDFKQAIFEGVKTPSKRTGFDLYGDSIMVYKNFDGSKGNFLMLNFNASETETLVTIDYVLVPNAQAQLDPLYYFLASTTPSTSFTSSYQFNTRVYNGGFSLVLNDKDFEINLHPNQQVELSLARYNKLASLILRASILIPANATMEYYDLINKFKGISNFYQIYKQYPEE